MLLYLIVGLLVLFGFLLYGVNNELHKFPNSIKLQYQEIANARSAEVGKELDKFVQEVKMISQSPVIRSMEIEKIQEYLPHLVLEGQHRNMTVASLDGVGWTTFGRYIDISEQEQYQKIILEGYSHWISQPFISPFADPDKPIVIISHAVRDDNQETIGLVNIVINSEFLNSIAESIDLGRTGSAWIVAEDGKVVAHPHLSVGSEKIITELLPSMDMNQLKKSELGWWESQTNDGDDRIIFYNEIENSPGWTLLLSIDVQEVLGPIRNTQVNIILFFIFCLIAILIFAYYYSTTISKPILDLKKVFEKAETGDLNVVANELVRNEVGAAAKSFNQMLSRIKKLTYYDSLTNLYNLNGFLVDLLHRAKRLKEEYRVIAIVVISIDDFKRINSLSGYRGGNIVLQKLAEELSLFIDKDESLGRYFGDEFILLLKSTSYKNLEKRIDELWKQCTTVMTIKDIEYRLKVSIGVASTEQWDVKVEDLVDKANIAKIDAKKQGGNLYRYYDHGINEVIKEEQKLENALYHAIDNKELYVVFQPIVDLKTNSIIGNEALIRWKHEQFQHVSPLKLIEIAEKSGFIIDIGKWVLKEALQQNKYWHDLGYSTLFVSVNISTIQFDQPNFVEMVKGVLEETNMDPRYLELEVTETNAMTFVEEKLTKMKKLKEMGISISIDDFGTGYSSLAYFTRFPIHTLKIDRSFVAKISEDENAKTIITTIINMAKTINIATTAEGVENEDQLKFLESQGCDKIQGYFISKPTKPNEIEQLLKVQ